MKRKVIAIVGTVGIPAKYGGFETLVEHLTREQSENFNFIVYCSSKAYQEKIDSYNGAKLKYIPLNANKIESIFYDIVSILDGIRKADIILILGVSGCIILPFVKLFVKKKVIVNIDGLEWKREKWGKAAKWFLKFSENIAVKNADIIIADNKVIQEHVFLRYDREAALIAYGADHCTRERISTQTMSEFPFLDQPYAFKVCRIEPENNVHLILKSFKNFPTRNLVIVGNWENSNYARDLRSQYQNFKHIFLLDPIYNQNKLNQIRSNCYIYIHGHSAGGTNPSLVEAMYLKLPVLSYGVNYNRETTNHKALYFDSCKTLHASLNNLNPELLREVAEDMFLIASEKYTWKKVSKSYAKIF